MKNPVIPYAIIAGLGIIAVILVSILGVNQQAAIEADDESAEEQVDDNAEEGEAMDDPEEVFENQCATCHGADLTGGMGPDLTEVGNSHSADEIKQIILEGKGEMPAFDFEDEQAEAIAEWLSEKK